MITNRRLLHLEGETLGEVGVRSVVYFVRPTVANAQLIAAQVKDLNRCAKDAWYSRSAAASSACRLAFSCIAMVLNM